MIKKHFHIGVDSHKFQDLMIQSHAEWKPGVNSNTLFFLTLTMLGAWDMR